MIHGTTQSVKIETLTKAGQVIQGAQCRVSNDKGEFTLSSGQDGPIHRSRGDLVIHCTQDGQEPATGLAISRMNAGMAGSVMLGSPLGLAIDAGTGAGFNYPERMQLVFGEDRRFDGLDQKVGQPTTGVVVEPAQFAPAQSAVDVRTPPRLPSVEWADGGRALSDPPASADAGRAPAALSTAAAERPKAVSLQDLDALLPARK